MILLQAQATGVTLYFANDLNENSYCIAADTHKLKQVISNLVSNAIKFANKVDGVVSVEVDEVTSSDLSHMDLQLKINSEKATSFVRLQVTDNGAGISKVSMHMINISVYF